MQPLCKYIVTCNGAKIHKIQSYEADKHIELEWRTKQAVNKNVNLGLRAFVQSQFHISDRFLDLLEIAGYIFATDRLIGRGSKNVVEAQSWSRNITIYCKIRDYEFWKSDIVKAKLNECLIFATGDNAWNFVFEPGHKTQQVNMFDREGCLIPSKNANISLFSGGLDSLSGAINLLENENKPLFLVSHISQNRIKKTQRKLYEALDKEYNRRISHYVFETNLHRIPRAKSETQRTRPFLFNSIAFTIAVTNKIYKHFVYENGFTSINLHQRADEINGRSSRTTHPKTIKLLEELFSIVAENNYEIELPFIMNTKKDIFSLIHKHNKESLIPLSVSCNTDVRTHGEFKNCGQCFQCVDRRLAGYSAELEDFDRLYQFDFITDSIPAKSRSYILDYIRQAAKLSNISLDAFVEDYFNELLDLYVNSNGITNDNYCEEKIFYLCQAHGRNVLSALRKIRYKHDDIRKQVIKDSLLDILNQRPFLKQDVQLLSEKMCERFRRAIPIAFKSDQPKREANINDLINSLLADYEQDYKREFPNISFALARTVPDHEYRDMLIEGKYIRGATSPSVVTKGISEDLIKYPLDKFILFVVYDPQRAIYDDQVYSKDLESKRENCKICVIR